MLANMLHKSFRLTLCLRKSGIVPLPSQHKPTRHRLVTECTERREGGEGEVRAIEQKRAKVTAQENINMAELCKGKEHSRRELRRLIF